MQSNQNSNYGAAEKSSRLSDFLYEKALLYKNALSELSPEQILKFTAALDEEETRRIKAFAQETGSENEDPNGFDLLDKIWDLASQHRFSWNQSENDSSSKGFIFRLLDFDFDWVFSWWVSREVPERSSFASPSELEDFIIDAFSFGDFRKVWSILPERNLAFIIKSKPGFERFLPDEFKKTSLKTILMNNYTSGKVLEILSENDALSNHSSVIENICTLQASEAARLLNEFMKAWRSPSIADPISQTIGKGNEKIDKIFRAFWNDERNASLGKESFSDLVDPKYFGPAFISAVKESKDSYKSELGYFAGVRLAKQEIKPSAEAVRAQLNDIDVSLLEILDEKTIEDIVPVAELWHTLWLLMEYASKYDHQTELTGLRMVAATLAEKYPQIWAESLEWILTKASQIKGFVFSITLKLASINREVRNIIETLSESENQDLRLKASGLKAILNGFEKPNSEIARTLADAAAQFMDGVPFFPHPLEPLSATWLGSLGVEQLLNAAVKRAAGEFSKDLQTQGGDIEETLTKSLIKELELEFRSTELQIPLLGSSPKKNSAPIVSVSQRPISKSTEEPKYGCDLAFLVKADVPNRYLNTWADLVQVKKSNSLLNTEAAKSAGDSWMIKNKQLSDLLKWSATSVYWLFAVTGDVFVLPAKHLLAIKKGTGKSKGKSFTVGYAQVRSAAIPLEQYLVGLLIGQWLGTSAEETVKFAEGSLPNLRPKAIIEINVSIPDGQ